MIPKRLFWLTVGYGAGLGSSWYAARKVKAAARRYTPDGLADRVSEAVSDTSRKVRTAVAEGRDAMHRREAELRGAASGSAELRGAVSSSAELRGAASGSAELRGAASGSAELRGAASGSAERGRRPHALGEPNRRGVHQPVR